MIVIMTSHYPKYFMCINSFILTLALLGINKSIYVRQLAHSIAHIEGHSKFDLFPLAIRFTILVHNLLIHSEGFVRGYSFCCFLSIWTNLNAFGSTKMKSWDRIWMQAVSLGSGEVITGKGKFIKGWLISESLPWAFGVQSYGGPSGRPLGKYLNSLFQEVRELENLCHCFRVIPGPLVPPTSCFLHVHFDWTRSRTQKGTRPVTWGVSRGNTQSFCYNYTTT